MENEKSNLYPILPSAPPVPEFPPNSNDFRTQEITKYRKEIEEDINKYEAILKKKKKFFNVCHYVNSTCNGIGVISSTGSITILALSMTGIGLPLVGVALGAGVTSLITNTFLKKLVTKIKKYEKLVQNAKSSYTTINCILSKALFDEDISIAEFKVISKEYENYSKNYHTIKSKFRTELSTREADMKMELDAIKNHIKSLKK